MNEDWLDIFPHSMAVFRWEVVSDHCSCVVTNLPMEKVGIKLFRFKKIWTDHPGFKEVVMSSWRVPVKAIGLSTIYLKTMRLKHRLKKFNRDNTGDIGMNYHSATDAYQEAQFQAQSHPRDYNLQEVVKVAAEALTVQEHIAELKIVLQPILLSKVVSHFVEHFRSHLGSPSLATGRIDLHCIEMGTKLSIDQQLLLLKPFSRKEIRAALFGIPITKSPGLDGFGSSFFKVLWKKIGDEVCSAIGQCFDTGHFPSALHETTLSLVPKVTNPSRAIDCIPIPCCSTLNKCIAKLLCSRMALVLPDLIQPNQGGPYQELWEDLYFA
ncbi:uncharacterized protein LOC133825990 [Humulus lupulus]|uniref:uncharacterized protein LOC133825990 n=1 Tax=Humulus lupulus TaxID=3486 RepID=UPI002B401CC6|nr:uncharacterized protein LOC133825990 [Humulus lupulus]